MQRMNAGMHALPERSISLITLELVLVTKSAISPVKMGFISY